MELVRNLPQQYRQDPWVLALADAILGVLEDQSRRSLELRAQLSLETGGGDRAACRRHPGEPAQRIGCPIPLQR